MKLPFDLSKFQKVDVNRDHTVMRSPEGHLIHISHKALKKDVREALRQLPVQKLSKGGVVEKAEGYSKGGCVPGFKRMADGGLVEEDEGNVLTRPIKVKPEDIAQLFQARGTEGLAPADKGAQAVVSGVAGPGAIPSAVGQELATYPADAQAEATQAAQSKLGITPIAEAQPQVDPEAPMAAVPPQTEARTPAQALPPDKLSQALEQTQQGMKGEAKVAQQTAQTQADLLGQTIDQMQTKYKESQDRQQAIMKMNDQLVTDLQKIDPASLTTQRSLEGRIASAIGIMLGGGLIVGAVNKYLDQEVEAQKSLKSHKETLFKLNQQRLGDERAAADMTKLNLLSLVELKLKQAMQKGVADSAMPNLQKSLGQLSLEKSDLIQKIEARQQAMQQPQNQAVTVDQAEQLIRAGRVPGQFQAEAMKELEFVKGLNTAMGDIQKAYAKAMGANVASAIAGKALPGGTPSSRDVEQANATIENIVRKNRPPGSGQFTDSDAEAMIAPFKLTVGDLTNPKAIQTKMKGLQEALKRDFSKTGTLGTYGIKIAPPASTNFNSTGRKAGK